MVVPPDTERGSFIWTDHGRFVEVHPVATGWLVVWGHYEDFGSIRVDEGNVTYGSLAGARRRVADAALELTRRPQAASDATTLFDYHEFPPHDADIPAPLE
jgi:hypothetical protein